MAETIRWGKNWVPMSYPRIRVRTDPMTDGYHFYILTDTHFVSEIKFEERPEEGLIIKPLAVISSRNTEVLQNLFNDLWREGFRPADGTGNAGHLEAIQGHLDDMRKIAFRKLGIEL